MHVLSYRMEKVWSMPYAVVVKILCDRARTLKQVKLQLPSCYGEGVPCDT